MSEVLENTQYLIYSQNASYGLLTFCATCAMAISAFGFFMYNTTLKYTISLLLLTFNILRQTSVCRCSAINTFMRSLPSEAMKQVPQFDVLHVILQSLLTRSTFKGIIPLASSTGPLRIHLWTVCQPEWETAPAFSENTHRPVVTLAYPPGGTVFSCKSQRLHSSSLCTPTTPVF